MIIDVDNIRRDPRGDELEQLAYQLKGLKAMRDALDAQDGLYLSTRDGAVFGQLTKAESKEPARRLREKISLKIEQAQKEIRKQTAF